MTILDLYKVCNSKTVVTIISDDFEKTTLYNGLLDACPMELLEKNVVYITAFGGNHIIMEVF